MLVHDHLMNSRFIPYVTGDLNATLSNSSTKHLSLTPGIWSLTISDYVIFALLTTTADLYITVNAQFALQRGEVAFKFKVDQNCYFAVKRLGSSTVYVALARLEDL